MTEPKVMAPQEWVLERKLKLVRELNCRDFFDQLEANDVAVAETDREMTKANQALQAMKVEADDAESLVALGIEGKNETERKAKKTQLLREDATYRSIQSSIQMLEGSALELRDKLEALRRNGKRLELQIKYRIAILEAIAS